MAREPLAHGEMGRLGSVLSDRGRYASGAFGKLCAFGLAALLHHMVHVLELVRVHELGHGVEGVALASA